MLQRQVRLQEKAMEKSVVNKVVMRRQCTLSSQIELWTALTAPTQWGKVSSLNVTAGRKVKTSSWGWSASFTRFLTNLWWFHSFLPLPRFFFLSVSYCSTLVARWRLPGFPLGSAAPAAKTPYLWLAACRQEAGVRRCRGQRLPDDMGNGLMDEPRSSGKYGLILEFDTNCNVRKVWRKWRMWELNESGNNEGDPRTRDSPGSVSTDDFTSHTCLLELVDGASLQHVVFSAARLTGGDC